jgi:hypothetical protein
MCQLRVAIPVRADGDAYLATIDFVTLQVLAAHAGRMFV